MARTQTHKQPKMTAEDARTFAGFSTASYSQTMAAIDDRKASGRHTDCTCEPYEDIFNWARWDAMGYHIVRGETSLKIHSYVQCTPKPKTDAETGKEIPQKSYMKPHTHILFCRCQVELN